MRGTSGTSASVNGLDVERIRWESELGQRMRSQVVWGWLSDAWKEKLFSALWLSSHGIDEAIDFCDALCDDIRDMIARATRAGQLDSK